MRLKTLTFCVQTFGRRPWGLETIKVSRFTSATEAERAGELLSKAVAGVMVYAIEGEPESDIWGEPMLLASHGDVPAVRLQPF